MKNPQACIEWTAPVVTDSLRENGANCWRKVEDWACCTGELELPLIICLCCSCPLLAPALWS